MKAVVFHIRDDLWLHRWPSDFPELVWGHAFSHTALEREIADADILLLTNRAASREAGDIIRNKAQRLKWIHFLTAGFDRGIAMGLPKNVRVSYSAGVKAPMVAEHAVALLLALVRALPAIAAAQRKHQWHREEMTEKMHSLEDATVCITGLGYVGRDVAMKLKPFRAHVIAVSRSGEADSYINRVYRRNQMREALAQSDALVLCTGADKESVAMIGRDEIAAMKPGAFLVNIARGSLIDEPALIEALKAGYLGGAGLDVQATEPLSETSLLWDLPNVIVSPHSAGAGSNGYIPHSILFRKNLDRFLANETLINQYHP